MPQSGDGDQGVGRTEAELMRILKASDTRCCVCVFAAEVVVRFIDNLFYENVNDVATRDRIRRSTGFCRYHAQLISDQADALGTAIILHDVVRSTMREIERGRFADAPPSNPLLRLFDNRSERREEEPCIVCVAEAGSVDLALDGLCRLVTGQAGLDLFERSHGLCIPHFRRGAGRHGSRPCWPRILEVERRTLGELAAQLKRLADSYDYQSTDAQGPEVRRSWREGLNITSSWIDICRR